MKLQSKKGSAGFTLMEILVVIIILGVLAGLAAPVFTKTKKKAFQAEARQTLNALRQSQIRYFTENNKYTATIGDLDFNPNDTVTGAGRKFFYAVSAGSATAFSANGELCSADGATTNCTAAPTTSVGKVAIDQTGAITTTNF